jgi:hypothetical protein
MQGMMLCSYTVTVQRPAQHALQLDQRVAANARGVGEPQVITRSRFQHPRWYF